MAAVSPWTVLRAHHPFPVLPMNLWKAEYCPEDAKRAAVKTKLEEELGDEEKVQRIQAMLTVSGLILEMKHRNGRELRGK